MTKWQYAVKQCSYEALQSVLREYGNFGWDLGAVVEGPRYDYLTVIFKRPERGDDNANVRLTDTPPTLSIADAKAQLGLDNVVAMEDQERTVTEATARSRHPAASFDGVSPAPRVC